MNHQLLVLHQFNDLSNAFQKATAAKPFLLNM